MHRYAITTKLVTMTGALAITLFGLVVAPAASQAATMAKAKKAPELYYLSLGDSYSEGYQTPALVDGPGYTDKVAKKEHMQLENFGCGGATTTSLLNTVGCSSGQQEVAHEVLYPTTTQEVAALDFISEHPGQIGLITVSIGGNDVTSCAVQANPVSCVVAASTTITTNVDKLVSDLDTALTSNGDTARLVGLTYPDVILGADVFPVGATNPVLAGESVLAFDSIINPALKAAYTSVTYGSFVDVTDAPYVKGPIAATAGDDTGSWSLTTGAYTGPTTKFMPFGKTVPESVAEVCKLTYYCSIVGDIHPTTKGYAFIDSLVLPDLGV
jgi:lysophospholipase L1-like esterase